MLTKTSTKINTTCIYQMLDFLIYQTKILFIILKKLDNMNVLYSLSSVDNQRLDMVIQEKTFTNTLNFVLTASTDDILSIPDPILNRFCSNILLEIDHNVKSLVIESKFMERVLRAANYPNLTELKLINLKDKIVSSYLTGKTIGLNEEG